jgi:hypothetical protein
MMFHCISIKVSYSTQYNKMIAQNFLLTFSHNAINSYSIFSHFCYYFIQYYFENVFLNIKI